MGFLHGVRQIGEYFEEINLKHVPEELHDLYNFLTLPLGIPNPQQKEDQRPQEIRVPLQVKDVNAEILNVVGVGNFILADYCGGGSVEEMRWKYLYRKPPGSNTTWKFSPLYKLGKGVGDKAFDELVGEQGGSGWKQNGGSHFNKLYKSTLRGFETGGCFGNGSVDVIMEALEQRVQELAKLWSDKKRSYLLLFGVQGPNGEFLFPGEVRAFRAYFRNKKKKTEASKSGKMKSIALQERWCALCHADLEESTYSVKDIYAFATFDKKNFLPAGNSKFIDKVFPLCSRCYTLISGGATAVKDKSVLKLGGALSSEKQKEGQGKKEWALSSMEIWVVPEVIGKPAFKQLIQDGKSYLKEGVESEERYLDLLARRDASFVYHFLFVEQNRAQLILHRLIEDVPPSHFRKLQKLWKEVNGRFDLNGKKEKQMGLDTAIRTIAALLMSLAVNRKENKEKLNEEQKVMKENVLTVIASLFQNQLIDVRYYKTLAVSRLTGLFSDEDWIRPKNKEAYDGASQLHSLWMLFEFFTLFNQTIGIEGDDL